MALQTAYVHISETDCREKKMSERFFLNRLCKLFLPGCIFSQDKPVPSAPFAFPQRLLLIWASLSVSTLWAPALSAQCLLGYTNIYPLFLIDFDKPDFKRNIVCLEDLQVGTVLTGKVENATLFGVFVDIGVGKLGLIPIRSITEAKLSKTKKRRSLGLGPGEKVEVKVLNIDIPRCRISLDLLRVLWVPRWRPSTIVFPHFKDKPKLRRPRQQRDRILGRSHAILTPRLENNS